MSRHDPEKLYPGFPGTEPSEHIRTIPACAALGMRQRATIGEPVSTSLDAALPAACDAEGRVSRGAALVLADQATAGGVFTTLMRPTPMMTLDLRVDWFGPLPASPISCTIDEVTREGDLALARGRIVSEGKSVGAAVARYLIGSMPGGTPGRMDGRDEILPPSPAASFADYLSADATADGMTMQPRPEHVGAPLPAYHGGVIAGLLEQAGVAAIDPAFRPLDIEIRFLAPALATLPLVARVVPRRTGRRAITLDIDAHQGDPNRPVAIARMLAITDPAGDPVRYDLPRG
ncbi:acyl-CoA thioesterase domain-containing protein [Sphingomonas mucosissima]|uniref:Thioesterase superfamily protein n=1 Tax=Sphingomonas mucosissima TaxID=370959 RepID=A0A245ZJ12_9SPHN|nr:acyl-CoA thioesterase domain-containing protein [Sphingomonas mucosissima]OWK29716.1 thioesterase superfamily protein [Sphingomonas mucosissima]